MISNFLQEMTHKHSDEKSNTLPQSSSEKCQKPSKSSTLPISKTKTRPEISKPILQTATPTAASLISKAPSTGVPRNSILSSNHKHDRPHRSSRGVVFCDTLIMPSPTNPNTPPIIHQNHVINATDDIEEIHPVKICETVCAQPITVVTPTWSVVSLPKQETVICRIESFPDNEDSLISPDYVSAEKLIHSFSKIRSKLRKKSKKDHSPNSSICERNRLRGLEISGPILQTSLDSSRFNLVPVCRAPGVEPISEHTYVNVRISDHDEAKQSPSLVSNGCRDLSSSLCTSPIKSRRPISISSIKSLRPTARPPQPPPSRTARDVSPCEPFYSTIGDTGDKEIHSQHPPPLLPPRPVSLVMPQGSSGSTPVDTPQDALESSSSAVLSDAESNEFLNEIINEMKISASSDVIESIFNK